jgi:hypothetical protein
MKFSIVFNKSGDFLEFVALSQDTYAVLEYYVDQLNKNNTNCFWTRNDSNYFNDRIEYLCTNLKNVNKILGAITGGSFEIFNDKKKYLNQQVLNKYHADWVQSQSTPYNIDEYRNSQNLAISTTANILHDMFPDDERTPLFGNILSKLEQSEIYSRLNVAVHSLEQAFDCICYSVSEWIEFANPFSKSLITNDSSNFRISFNHLGRSLYNKYQTFDTELKFNDENTFNELLGYVDLSLTRPQTNPYSPEYLGWCKQHNREPSGRQLNIGNIINFEDRLTDYRLLVYKNICSNSSFSINLNKG